MSAMFQPPKLGIGMIFSAALTPFLRRRPDALDVLEIEPQTLWLADDPIDGPFAEFRPALEAFSELPQAKLVHSVGVPLGGTRRPDPGQMALLKATADRLNSPWVSEHLSVAGTPHQSAGFLLPPLQTEDGVATAVANIQAFKAGLGRPVAVETGVAYLKRKAFEMPDGVFLRRVAEEADCGLLLDLHNLWCNHINDRIDIDETLSQIPFDRVWEVHLAGGEEMGGVWLDSHSGAMPDALAARAREVIAELPNLGAVNFEIYDTFLERVDDAEFDQIVEDLRSIWAHAGQSRSDLRPFDIVTPVDSHDTSPAQWEDSLTRAVWKSDPSGHLWPEDHPLLTLYAFLARSFRGSLLTRALPRAVRYGLLRDGDRFEQTLSAYFDAQSPQMFAPLEAAAFRNWLIAQGEHDPLMLGLLDYDMAFIEMLTSDTPKIVRFPGDPAPVFEALVEGRLPAQPKPPEWELEILPDATSDGFSAQSAG
ncbi:DUF692 domain-containing protein [Marivita sp. S6314]|uniref:DUF692 domain-containing protein n=1 Tax=Marivita sp. S6314 TaxID=2926406 RepID=UPI001FF17733|nr:DUF692 family multinuclear iron-containing protein [Marivita sp. S6314]MCK0149101.1 DUF692 domain-containing protein [Marivita sp. S6314]